MSFKTTLIPQYTDTIVFQKESFYKNNSNLLDIFNDYLKELNLNLEYEAGKSSGDILKNNVLFFEKLNKNDFKIKSKLNNGINRVPFFPITFKKLSIIIFMSNAIFFFLNSNNKRLIFACNKKVSPSHKPDLIHLSDNSFKINFFSREKK